jgi:hypothetical protein
MVMGYNVEEGMWINLGLQSTLVDCEVNLGKVHVLTVQRKASTSVFSN